MDECKLFKSVTSVGVNVVEAKSAHANKDYIKFFEIALKSANETKYWIVLIREIKKDFKDEVNILLNENIEIAKILASSILILKNKKK